MEFLNKLISKDDTVSSARFINVLGAFTGFVLIITDTALSGALSATHLTIYLSYCGGVYAASKTLTVIDNKNNKVSLGDKE